MPHRFLLRIFIVVYLFSLNLVAQDYVFTGQPVLSRQHFLIASWNFNDISSAPESQLAVSHGIGTLTTNWGSGAISKTPGTSINIFGPDFVGDALVLESGPENLNEGRQLTFRVSTENFEALSLSYATGRSSSGFLEQHWSWSLDGIEFTANKIISVPDQYGLVSVLFSEEISDASEVYFRVEFKGLPENPDQNGNNRIDNVQITGRTIRRTAGVGTITVGNVIDESRFPSPFFNPGEEEVMELKFERSHDEEDERFEAISAISIEFPPGWPVLDLDAIAFSNAFAGADIDISDRKIEITNAKLHYNSSGTIRITQKTPELEDLSGFGRIPIDVRTAFEDEELLPISSMPEAFLFIPIERLHEIEAGDSIIGQRVAVKGTISEDLSSGRLSWMYLQDETGGTAVCEITSHGIPSWTRGFPGLSYAVIGEVRMQSETVWLYPGPSGSVMRLGLEFDHLEPQTRTIGELLENPKFFEGRLVQINYVGLTADSEDWPDILEDGSITVREKNGEMRIDLFRRRGPGIQEPAYPADVVGIFSRFDPLSGDDKPKLILTGYHPARPTAGFQAWQERFFEEEEAGFPIAAGPESDPDGDGVANLLEYAFGGNPHKPGDAFLPKILMEGENPEFVFRRVQEASDLIYEIQASEDLVVWETIWSSLDFPYESDLFSLEEKIRLESEAGTEKRRFLKIRVVADSEKPQQP